LNQLSPGPGEHVVTSLSGIGALEFDFQTSTFRQRGNNVLSRSRKAGSNRFWQHDVLVVALDDGDVEWGRKRRRIATFIVEL
jgi:hypothetical protein